jgi:hypothetical protein
MTHPAKCLAVPTLDLTRIKAASSTKPTIPPHLGLPTLPAVEL